MERGIGSDCELAWTGERFIAGVQGDVVLEHLHRYALALELAREKAVLDIASGEGYGSSLLAHVARKVVGVDIDSKSVCHATRRYARDNLSFRTGSATDIPLESASIDLIVSFETLEHLAEHDRMLAEIKRVLVPGGMLIISTPDRRTYSEIPGYSNPYHVKELDRDEFAALMGRYFRSCIILGERVCQGSLLAPLAGTEYESERFTSLAGNYEGIDGEAGLRAPIYLVAAATDGDLPRLRVPSLFEGIDILSNSGLQLRQAEDNIARLDQELAAARSAAVDLEARGERLRAQVAESDRRLRAQVAESDRVLAERERQLGQVLTERVQLLGELAEVKEALTVTDQRLSNTQEELARVVADLTGTLHSRSWRVTAPLRATGRLARAARGVGRTAAAAARANLALTRKAEPRRATAPCGHPDRNGTSSPGVVSHRDEPSEAIVRTQADAATPDNAVGRDDWNDESLALRLREMFGQQLVPSPPRRTPATDRLFARLDGDDLARTLAVLRDRLDSETYRTLTEVLPSSAPEHYKREVLRYGTHYLPELVAAKTLLSDANPPATVHSMMRADIFVGDMYSGDLFIEELERCTLRIGPGGRYLDFGCSSGAAVRYLRAAYPEAEWYGCDPVEASIAWASANLDGIDFRVNPQWPPLPYDACTFDGVYAISIWSHFSERAALAWFGEMDRVIKPGGVLMFTTHGVVTVDYILKHKWRSYQGILDIAADLQAGRFRFEDSYAHNAQVQSELASISDWGDAFIPLSWVVRLLDRWDLLSFQPGRNQFNQDLYLLRRKPDAASA